jgi:hypothetical protein
MIHLFLAVVLASVARETHAAAPVEASDTSGLHGQLYEGRHELSLYFSPDFEGPIGDTTILEGGYGVFVTDSVLVRGVVEYGLLEDVVGADDDYRTQAYGVGAEYHFRTEGTVVPYVGLDLGYRRTNAGGTVESGLAYGPRLGTKFLLNDNVFLDFTLTYQLSSADVFLNDFELEDTDFAASLGLRVLL